MWQSILATICFSCFVLPHFIDPKGGTSVVAVSDPVPIPLRTFNADETRAVLQQRLPPVDVEIVLELISDVFFNNGTSAGTVDVDCIMGYGLARLRNCNATTDSNTQAYAAALRQYLHSNVDVDQIAEAFVKFAIGKNDKELSAGRSQVLNMLIKGSRAQATLRNATLTIINPFVCRDETTMNRGAIRHMYWSRLPLVEANVIIDSALNAIFGVFDADIKKGVEAHIIYIADAYLALAALQKANITDPYYPNVFTLTDVARANAQLLQHNLPLDDTNDIEDALSIIATADTDIEKNRGYFKILQLLTNGVLAQAALDSNGIAVDSNGVELQETSTARKDGDIAPAIGKGGASHPSNVISFVLAAVLLGIQYR